MAQARAGRRNQMAPHPQPGGSRLALVLAQPQLTPNICMMLADGFERRRRAYHAGRSALTPLAPNRHGGGAAMGADLSAALPAGPVCSAGWRRGCPAQPRRHGGKPLYQLARTPARGAAHGAGGEARPGSARTVTGIWRGGRPGPRWRESGLSARSAFCGPARTPVAGPGPGRGRPEPTARPAPGRI